MPVCTDRELGKKGKRFITGCICNTVPGFLFTVIHLVVTCQFCMLLAYVISFSNSVLYCSLSLLFLRSIIENIPFDIKQIQLTRKLLLNSTYRYHFH